MMRLAKLAVVMTVAWLSCGFVMVKHDLAVELEVVPGVLPGGEYLAVLDGERYTIRVEGGTGPVTAVEGRNARGEVSKGEARALRLPGLPASTYVLQVRLHDKRTGRLSAEYWYLFLQVRKGHITAFLPVLKNREPLPTGIKDMQGRGQYDYFGLADDKTARAYLSAVWQVGENGARLMSAIVAPLR